MDEVTQEKLDDVEKYLLGDGDNDEIFKDRVFTGGNIYRKEHKTSVFVKKIKFWCKFLFIVTKAPS